MSTRHVTDPSGVVWRVRRRWIPHREGKGINARLKKLRESRSRKKKRDDQKSSRWDWLDIADVGGGCGDDIGVAILAIVTVVLVVILVGVLIAFGPGLILIGIDLAWLVGVFLFGLIARFVFRRPWLVEAHSQSGERRQWAVQGFRAAGKARDEIAADLAAGLQPLPGGA